MKEVIQEAVRLLGEAQPCVLATVVRTKGSTPQKPGAKLLVRKDGSGVGTLGGGCVEGTSGSPPRRYCAARAAPSSAHYLLNEDIAARDGAGVRRHHVHLHRAAVGAPGVPPLR